MLPVITLGALRLTGGKGQPALFDSTSQLLAAVAAILPFRVSFVTGNCTTGDVVFTVSWKHVGLTVFFVFLAWAWAYWQVRYTETC
jgi:hypothetical protein